MWLVVEVLGYCALWDSRNHVSLIPLYLESPHSVWHIVNILICNELGLNGNAMVG